MVTFFLQDLNLSTERLTSNKAFTNKLWNAGKFILQNLPTQNDSQSWDSILSFEVSLLLTFTLVSSYVIHDSVIRFFHSYVSYGDFL